MGNGPSAVEQRVEHGSKTGVCSLRELKLERVNFLCVALAAYVVNWKGYTLKPCVPSGP